ncbi:hypothetical protein FHG87_009932 [Trinorchestia longiramus]|nr:hypothetical protein FHG87_009932 [Trinorchestia longiramus]
MSTVIMQMLTVILHRWSDGGGRGLEHINVGTRQNNILDLVITTLDHRTFCLEVSGKIGDHHVIDLALQVHIPIARNSLSCSNDRRWQEFFHWLNRR